LAIVQNGDMVELRRPSRQHPDISDDELAARLAQWTPVSRHRTGMLNYIASRI
jgi:dihydroxy-acid dehydratase